MPKPLLLILIFSLMIAADLSAAVIRMKSEVQIEQSLIRLGDVAVISEADSATIDQLQQLTVGPSPATGKTIVIPLDTVRRELTLRGIDQSTFQFAGSSETVVIRLEPLSETPKRRPVSDQQLDKLNSQLQQAVSRYLQQVAPELGQLDIAVTEMEIKRLQHLLKDFQNLQLTGGQQPWTGVQVFQLQGDLADGTMISEYLTCQISYRPRLLALRQGLARGQMIRPADLVWVQPLNSQTGLTDPEKVIGTELVRSVRAEIPLQADDIRPLPMIRRNDVVAVTAQIGNITVKRYCRSLDEGAQGEYVTLIPVDGKEKISARVSGLRAAEIVLTATVADTDYTEPTVQPRPDTITPHSPTQSLTLGQTHLAPPLTGTVSGPAGMKPAVMIVPASSSQTIPAGTSRILANQPAQLPPVSSK